MPNILDKNGLQVKTRQELLDELTQAFKTIYGSDINLDQDTPDGQILNIFAQSYQDILDLLVQIYTSFDPDQAVGKTLDQRVAINGIQRQAGTHTITDVTVVTNRALTLYGLDQEGNEVFTVSDNEGNKFELINTQAITAAGSHVMQFQAKEKGAVLTIPNTITNADTVVIGVDSINNPNSYSILGINEESDFQLKERRRKSVSLASQGFLRGLRAALENINGVTSAYVYENVTGAEDADGIPGHSIWVIISGTASDLEVAETIYQKRNAGAGMKGDIAFPLTQVDGTSFVIRWDRVTTEQVFVELNITSIDGINQPNLEAIREELAVNLFTAVNEDLNYNYIASEVQKIDSNALVVSANLHTGKIQKIIFSTAPTTGSFKVSYAGNDSAVINYNDDATTMQAKIRAIQGLENIFVSGSVSSQEIVISFEDHYDSVPHLIFTKEADTLDADLSMVFPGSVLIKPTSKKYQFVYSEQNILLYNLTINPRTYTLTSGQSKSFEASGGYGDLVFSIETDSSGGASITNSGVYTAGSGTGIDTIKVSDVFGKTTTIQVTVV